MRMRMRTALWLAPALLAAACTATQPAGVAETGAPGFLFGFWHGVIAPFAFLISIFVDSVRIYAFPNSGLWYDLAFMLGIGGFSGGALASSKRRAK